MIRIINNINWMPEKGQEHSFHYITFTPYSLYASSNYSSMMWNYATCLIITGLSEEDICFYFNLVDNNSDVGTLYPLHNVTFIPSPFFRSYSNDKLKSLFDEVKKSNTMINKKNVYLDLRNNCARDLDVINSLNGTKNDSYWDNYNLYIITDKDSD